MSQPHPPPAEQVEFPEASEFPEPPEAPGPAAAPAPPDEDAEHSRHLLRALLDQLARAAANLTDTLCAPLPDDPDAAARACALKPKLAASLDRVGHGLRMTILQADRRAAAAAHPHNRAQRHAAARQRIMREVEDAIQREEQAERAESMEYEVLERIHAPGFDAELDTTALPELITAITHDLGLGRLPGNHPWKRRTPNDVADLQFWASPAGAAEFRTHPKRPPGWLPAADPAPD